MDSAFDLKNKEKEKIVPNNKLESVLFSRNFKSNNFFTNDSGLYFDCQDKLTADWIEFKSKNELFDSLNHKAIGNYKKFRGNNGWLYLKYRDIVLKINRYQKYASKEGVVFFDKVSILKLWNTSILAAIIIGMVSMSFVYRYLGQGVDAKDNQGEKVIAGVSIEKVEEPKWTKEKEENYVAEISKYLEAEANKEFNIKAKELVKGYPIEEMLPYIIEKDHRVAAFYIAIAKKESNWGKRVPVLNGEDCYNYVGYRGGGDRLGSGGHTCFASRKEAVDVVSKRISELINKYDRDTAKEMVVWKCGSNCAVTGGQASANKWIDDVDMYLKKLNQDK